ncbi:DUF4304 domain-containing protein [Litorisediminicola beolgyonensis]|uniref:DUF4304 domain-containing protein n=1 Tax=Litorisediminicola beolgyonensis TaxID=1173614 RepID=A0ABW3ZM33_9RHOB
MSAPQSFPVPTEAALSEMLIARGFARRRPRVWTRGCAEVLQVVHLQRSQYDPDRRYLNFALWPLVWGAPPTPAESKMPFRTRAESLKARDMAGFFARIDGLTTLAHLAEALAQSDIAGLVSRDLRDLLSAEHPQAQ